MKIQYTLYCTTHVIHKKFHYIQYHMCVDIILLVANDVINFVFQINKMIVEVMKVMIRLEKLDLYLKTRIHVGLLCVQKLKWY